MTTEETNNMKRILKDEKSDASPRINLSKDERDKIIEAAKKHDGKPGWKDIFHRGRCGQTFVYFIGYGQTQIIIDLKKRTDDVLIEEITDPNCIPVCGGGAQNVFNIEFLNKHGKHKLIIYADVKTCYAVIYVTIR